MRAMLSAVCGEILLSGQEIDRLRKVNRSGPFSQRDLIKAHQARSSKGISSGFAYLAKAPKAFHMTDLKQSPLIHYPKHKEDICQDVLPHDFHIPLSFATGHVVDNRPVRETEEDSAKNCGN